VLQMQIRWIRRIKAVFCIDSMQNFQGTICIYPRSICGLPFSDLTAFSEADFLIGTSNFLENFGLYESQEVVNVVIQG
jgi:hypothetical protein